VHLLGKLLYNYVINTVLNLSKDKDFIYRYIQYQRILLRQSGTVSTASDWIASNFTQSYHPAASV